MQREIPLYTLSGVPDAKATVHPFSTADKLGLTLTRFTRGNGSNDAVLLMHGLTQSSDMFIMPEHHNLVRYLLDNGFNDVWCVDNRMSNHFPYNASGVHYNLDDVALYDHPATFAEVRKHIGNRPLHVISHCLGSASFTMALAAGVVEDIASAICNAVTLTPRVPAWSLTKLTVVPNTMEYALNQPYANPEWNNAPALSLGKMISRFASLVHTECNIPACQTLSLMWGAGHPAIYEHKNVADVTHRRIGDLHGPTGYQYYRHVRKMVNAGAAVKWTNDSAYNALPDNYMEKAGDIKTPIMFVTGVHNRVFVDSNQVCFEQINRLAPNRHSLKVYDGYGHNDVFMSKSADRDIFPSFVAYLSEQRARTKVA